MRKTEMQSDRSKEDYTCSSPCYLGEVLFVYNTKIIKSDGKFNALIL